MVHRTLGPGVPDDLAEDATDALAISLCHLFRAKMPRPSVVRKAVLRPARPGVFAGAKS
jgi:Holliday junction resolvasome RuvABC endonuclease subunit